MYNFKYINEIKKNNKLFDYHCFDNKTLCISGGTGLIGSFLVDTILCDENINCKIILLVRNLEKAKQRFAYFNTDKRLEFIRIDLTKKIIISDRIDYVLHLASLTDPYNYAKHPIQIMETNFIGSKNLLDLAKEKQAKFFLSSTCEVYGINDSHLIKENDYGYIDILDPRACYNESKKAAETLCACYKKEFDIDIVIGRLSRVYGPTMKLNDTKALSQFILKCLNKEDVVLKSLGEQEFNYSYVGDIVKAISILLVNSNKHLAYNITNNNVFKLKDIARFLAERNGKKVLFDIPDKIESQGYSKSKTSSLDASLFNEEYNYELKTDIYDGLNVTLSILEKNMENID